MCRNRASKFWITQIQMIDMLLGRSDRLWKKSPPHKDNYKKNSALKTASTGEKNKLDVVSGESRSPLRFCSDRVLVVISEKGPKLSKDDPVARQQ